LFLNNFIKKTENFLENQQKRPQKNENGATRVDPVHPLVEVDEGNEGVEHLGRHLVHLVEDEHRPLAVGEVAGDPLLELALQILDQFLLGFCLFFFVH
jgi:hypothetical protein